MREFIVRTALRQLGCLAFAGVLALPLYLVTPSQLRASSRGQVIGIPRIVDGDTLVVGEVRIRLDGIDAPESTQACGDASGGVWPCGAAATRHLAALVGRSEVRCDDLGPDKYRRTLGRCFVGSLNLNAEMVRAGYAWAFVRYSQAYVAVEAEARAARVGVWQGPAVAPWDFRRRAWETAEAAAPEGCTIKGNVNANGRVYHMPWNTWYDKVRMEPGRDGLVGGKRWFCSELEAQEAGWRPALTR
jgi:endonuclease YncB( thermonuclease family)